MTKHMIAMYEEKTEVIMLLNSCLTDMISITFYCMEKSSLNILLSNSFCASWKLVNDDRIYIFE